MKAVPIRYLPRYASEADLQRAVIEIARLYGWLVAHFRPARFANGEWRTPVEGDGKGFPDLVLCRPPRPGQKGRVIFAELKAERGKPTPEQQRWLDALRGAGEEVYLWRPSDLDDIIRILERREP